jgi:magnesium chelatase family protein
MSTEQRSAYGSVLIGLDAHLVRVWASVHAPSSVGWLTIEGLSDTAAREARVRLMSALASYAGQAAVTVHFEGLPQSGSFSPGPLDLAAIVAVLRVLNVNALQGAAANPETVFVGEVSLAGGVRPVRGALSRLAHGPRPYIVPAENEWEAGLASQGAEVYAVGSVADLMTPLVRVLPSRFAPHTPHGRDELPDALLPVFDAINALPRVLLVGAPGSGTIMLARRLASQALPLRSSEAADVARLHTVAGLVGNHALMTLRRPFRAPHHTVSEAGLLGGGFPARPGEVSLAHCGVLLLDELLEFRRSTLEALAHALRAGEVTAGRGDHVARFPAKPLTVVATAYATGKESEGYHKRLAELEALLKLKRFDVPALSTSEITKHGYL